jgi:hypothetical protein
MLAYSLALILLILLYEMEPRVLSLESPFILGKTAGLGAMSLYLLELRLARVQLLELEVL